MFYPSPSPLPPSTHDLQQASTLSRDLGLPQSCIAANSGAHIGLVEELKHLHKVAWENEKAPDKGFRYFYLSPADYIKVQLIETHWYTISV